MRASVDLSTDIASVRYDPAAVGVDEMIEAVRAAGYDAAPHSHHHEPGTVETLRRRLVAAAVLSAPVALPASIPGLRFDGWEWVAVALATPVVWWAGWPIHRATARNLRHGALTMDTLITIGTVALRTCPLSRRPAVGCCRQGHNEKGGSHVSTSTLEVFVAAFDSEGEAAEALKDFQTMHREGSIDLIDGAVVVHGADGKVHFTETADPSGKKWAARGAIAGGVVGLIFPPSIIGTAIVGGAAGGIWGKVRDKGFKDEDLRAIGDSLPPGSSAIIAVAEDRMVEQLERGLEGYSKIARHAVNAEAAAQLIAEIDDSGESDKS